jgi:hypothetical protein
MSGGSNTGVGFQVLTSNTTGDSNTAIGFLADVSAGGLTNATDRNRKENFLSLDGLAILDKLQRVLVTS